MACPFVRAVVVLAVGSMACGDSGTTGGNGGDGPSDGGAGGTTSVVGGASGEGGFGGAATGTCDALGVCEGDGMDPSTGCFECSINGDETVASDGGACLESYIACFGEAGTCLAEEGGDPECCAFIDCLNACDLDGNATIDPGPELDCVCENDGMVCTGPGTETCIGTHGQGYQLFIDVFTCVYTDTCPVACSE